MDWANDAWYERSGRPPPRSRCWLETVHALDRSGAASRPAGWSPAARSASTTAPRYRTAAAVAAHPRPLVDGRVVG